MPNTPGVADHGVPGPSFAERAKKFIVAAVGVAAMVVSTGVLEEDVEVWVNAALAIATAAGVYAAPNRTSKPHDDTLRA